MIGGIACAAFLVCPFVSGCGGLFSTGTRNLFNEAKIIRDNNFEQVHYAHLAHKAWERFRASCPGRTYSADYSEGFKSGFVDYLYAGGWGEPPALPPRRYRHFHAESPKGVEALQDWYEGFRHGAAVAKESGLRQFVVVSIPSPAAAQSPLPYLPFTGTPTGDTSPSTPQTLPTPRRTPAEESTNEGSAIQGSATKQPAPEEQP